MPRQITPMGLSHYFCGTVLLWAACGQAAAEPIDAARIGKELTAAGSAAAAGNGLPAYEGRDLPEAGWEPAANRLKHWKYRAEKPIATLTAQNLGAYAAKLTPGQRVLFAQNPSYQMNVYPTHRNCGWPQFVVDNTRKGLGQAKADAAGKSVAGGIYPSMPFPATVSGLEAIWNSQLKYGGVGSVFPAVKTVISPRAESKEWIINTSEIIGYSPLGTRGSVRLDDFEGVYNTAFIKYLEPAALAGQALVAKTRMGEATETYYYFPGQRRVRRMPTYAYDSPIMGMDNQMMVDVSYGFIGSPDRFDWKIVEERNILVPYNNFALSDPQAKLDDVVGDKSPTPQSRRYEEHRVYVIEATVKAGLRHTAPKRTLYLDVDTYQVVAAEDYDAQGKLWKVREVFTSPAWELEGTCVAWAYWQYDTASGRYVMDNVLAGTNSKPELLMDAKDSRFNLKFYTQDNLRAMSER